MTNGQTLVRSVGDILHKHGISAAIALYLVYVLTTTMGVKMDAMADQIDVMQAALFTHSAHQTQQADRLIRITIINCENQAQTVAEERRCRQ